MSGRSDIVDAARLWLGTPYRHQMAMRGAGTDCLGLLRGVWRDVFGGHNVGPKAACSRIVPDSVGMIFSDKSASAGESATRNLQLLIIVAELPQKSGSRRVPRVTPIQLFIQITRPSLRSGR